MEPPATIDAYLKLCGRPHNFRYVGISVMLSCFMNTPLEKSFFACVAT
jgi:hypothetical protein